jgi:diguanylate cyclase (GGDEF)-like protein/PAS domain S-box-containing protein
VFNRAFDRLHSLLPAETSAGPGQRFARELVLGFGTFELVAIGLFCLTELAWGTPQLGAIYAVAWLLIVSILAWLGRGGSTESVATALLVVLFALASVTNVATGGRSIGANIAMPTIVLFAVLMSPPRAAVFWFVLAVLEILVASQLRRIEYAFPITPRALWVASAVDRVPLVFALASALIAFVMRRALAYFQATLEAARRQADDTAERFTDFAELAADGFWETDASLRLTYVSRGFSAAMGLDNGQMLGRTPEQAYRLRFPGAPDLEAYMAPLRERRAFSGQLLELRDPEGKSRWLLNQGRPYWGSDDGFAGFRGIVHDVTAQYAAEEALRANEHRLQAITENVPAIIAYLDREQRYRFCNGLVGRVAGLENSLLLGRTMREVRGEEVYAGLAPHVAAALRGEAVTFEGEGEYENRHRFFQTSYVPDVDASDEVTGFYAITFDITEVKQSQVALAGVSRRLKLITDNMPALISYIDAAGVFRFNNSAYEAWLGRPLATITGSHVSQVYDADTYRQIQPQIQRALAGESVAFELEPSGSRQRHVSVNYVPEFAEDGRVRGIFGLIQDISELKRQAQQLRVLAENDALTGLPNRSRFEARLAEAIARSQRSGDLLALLFLDIDRFKAINDTLGHQAGDAVLQEFARRLCGCVRQTDGVTRLAGDEFVILLEGIHDRSEVACVAEKIVAAMTPAFDLANGAWNVSTSIGVAIRARDHLDGEALLRQADEALYAAKAAGRGSYHLATAV